MLDAQRLCTTVRTTCVRLRARNRHHNVPKEIKGYGLSLMRQCLQLSKIIRRKENNSIDITTYIACMLFSWPLRNESKFLGISEGFSHLYLVKKYKLLKKLVVFLGLAKKPLYSAFKTICEKLLGVLLE